MSFVVSVDGVGVYSVVTISQFLYDATHYQVAEHLGDFRVTTAYIQYLPTSTILLNTPAAGELGEVKGAWDRKRHLYPELLLMIQP